MLLRQLPILEIHFKFSLNFILLEAVPVNRLSVLIHLIRSDYMISRPFLQGTACARRVSFTYDFLDF